MHKSLKYIFLLFDKEKCAVCYFTSVMLNLWPPVWRLILLSLKTRVHTQQYCKRKKHTREGVFLLCMHKIRFASTVL